MKKVLYVALFIILFYLVLCIAGKGEVTIEREITISATKDRVMKLLVDLPFFQEKWSPWTEKDPKMEVNFSKNPGEIGHKYTWKGNDEVGQGTLEIVKITSDSIQQQLHFEGMGNSNTYFVVKAEHEQTKVIWGIKMEIGFFGRGVMIFMNMDKMMGTDFEKGLKKFKTVIEQMPIETENTIYTVTEVNWDEKMFIGKKGRFKFDQLNSFFDENFPKLFESLEKSKITSTMAPIAIYFKWDEQNAETECAVVANVPFGTKLPGWENFVIPASKVLYIAYFGSWAKSAKAHMTMDEYIKKNNLPMQSHVIEEYVTDPMLEKDTAKWLTNIFYVIPQSK